MLKLIRLNGKNTVLGYPQRVEFPYIEQFDANLKTGYIGTFSNHKKMLITNGEEFPKISISSEDLIFKFYFRVNDVNIDNLKCSNNKTIELVNVENEKITDMLTIEYYSLKYKQESYSTVLLNVDVERVTIHIGFLKYMEK